MSSSPPAVARVLRGPRHIVVPLASRPWFVAAAVSIVLAVTASCDRQTMGTASPAPDSGPTIQLLAPGDNPAGAVIEVIDLPTGDLASLRAAEMDRDRWTRLLKVSVRQEGSGVEAPAERGTLDVPAVLGSYVVEDAVIRFTPMFPFDPGRQYSAVFDPSYLPNSGRATTEAWRGRPITAIVGLPKPPVEPTTIVERVYPTADTLPENQLKLYIHFSAPMSAVDGLPYIQLLDEAGEEVEVPFLPLGAEFWDYDRQRYTVFFDPGRIKRGLQLSEQLGRSLTEGSTYTLGIDASWPDAEGNPLQRSFRREFRVGPADEAPIDPITWTLQSPQPGTRDPLVVAFPEPLDHGLMQRTLGVRTAEGQPVQGETEISHSETRWAFTPIVPWVAGTYRLVALSILEDLAGNQIGRPFEIDVFDRVDRPGDDRESVTIPFDIASPTLQ